MNRFDQPVQNNYQYSPEYAPLPLQDLAEMAREYSTRYRTGQNLKNKLPEYASKIKYRPGNEDMFNQWYSNSEKSISEITDSARPEDWADPLFQQKVMSQLNKIANDPLRMTIENNYNKWFKHKLDNENDLDFTYKKDANGNYLQSYGSDTDPKVIPYADAMDARLKMMSGIQESGYTKDMPYDFSKGVEAGPNGTYLAYDKVTNKVRQITQQDVEKLASIMNPLFYSSAEGKYELAKTLRPYLGDAAYDMSYEKLQQYAKNDPRYKSLLDYANNYNTDMLFRAGAKQIHQTIDQNIDQTTLKDDAKSKQMDIKASLLGETNDLVETPEVINATNQQLSEVTADGLVKFDQATGTYKVDYTKLTSNGTLQTEGPHPIYVQGTTTGTKKGINMNNEVKLAKFVQNAADALGYKGEINQQNRDIIINEYAKLMKVNTYATSLSPSEREIYTNNFINHPEAYAFVDEKGQMIDEGKAPNMTIQNSNGETTPRQLTITERMQIGDKDHRNTKFKVEYYDDDGTLQHAYVRPKNKIMSNYYDTVGKASDAGINYIQNGKASITEDQKLMQTTYDGKTVPIVITEGEYGPNQKTYNQVEVVQGSKPTEKIYIFANSNDRKDLKFYKYSYSLGKKPELQEMGDFDQFRRLYEKDFWNTEVGNGYIGELRNSQEQAKNIVR